MLTLLGSTPSIRCSTPQLISCRMPPARVGWDMSHQLPAPAIHLRAIGKLHNLVPNVHIRAAMGPLRLVSIRTHVVPQVQLLLAIHRIPIVPQSQMRVMPHTLAPVPPGEVRRSLHRRLQDPPLPVAVPPEHRCSRYNHPLLAIPSGEQKFGEPNPVKPDGPGRRTWRRVFLAVTLGAPQVVRGRVPSKSRRNVPHNLPAAAVNL
mmetsp:Transcript_46908/g.114993  ORF Transcript_46908/g.114993 Transcript_46908/m.114993 type:complete len:205 (-) Transcript_46908:1240-1854(-)